MDENLARVIVAGVVSITITVSMIAMAVAQVMSRRRKSELPDASIQRLEARLERMEQAIDAMASEVERVSEGQRFTTRLLADRAVERQP